MPEASLREQLESAYEHHEAPGTEAGRPAADAPESVGTPAEKADTGAAEGKTLGLGEDRGDGRRADGKFARRVAAADTTATAPATDGTVAAAHPADGTPAAVAPVADPYAKAPQSWKPGAREAWAQLPPDVRAEVHRREKEVARTVQETTQARQVMQHVSHMQQSYAPALQAEGVDVLTASANLMQLASRLRFGTPPEKAMLAAQIIRNYGVDVNALADALDGQPQRAQGAAPQGMYQDPRVDQLLAQISEVRE